MHAMQQPDCALYVSPPFFLFANIIDGVQRSGTTPFVAWAIFLKLLQGLIVCCVQYCQFKLVEHITDKVIILYYVKLITLAWCMLQLVRHHTYTIIFQKIKIKLDCFYKQQFLRHLFLNTNYEKLATQNGGAVNTAIADGTAAVIETLLFSVRVINPLIQTVGSLMILYWNVGIQYTLLVVALIGLVWICGMWMLRWEFYARENINVNTKRESPKILDTCKKPPETV